MEKQQAELEISMIKKIMEDSRKIVIDDGIGYIIWGVLIMIGLFSTYFIILFKQYTYVFWPWIIIIAGGWTYSFIYYWKKESIGKVKTFTGKILGGLWLAAGISMCLIGFGGPIFHAIGGLTVSPLMSVILGIAYYVSGIVYAKAWIRNLAIGWWAGALLMFIFPGLHTLLIFAGMMAVLQIIPGIILYIKFKKEYQPETNG